jgi:hypothetical protein
MMFRIPEEKLQKPRNLLQPKSAGLTIKSLNANLISIFDSSADLPQLYIISKILSREE